MPNSTMREVVPGPEGEGAFGKKVVAWNDRALLGEWRERWASLANERLLELGHDIRIDHRSYAEQGIALEPQHKIGPAGSRRGLRVGADREENAERAAEHREIARRNGEKIIAEPEVVLDAITRQHSTFTRRDLARFVDRHTADAAQFERALAKAEASPELVRLGIDGRGQARFSTRAMLEIERRMEVAAASIAARDSHRVSRVAGWRALQAAERQDWCSGRSSARRIATSPRGRIFPWWWATPGPARARCSGWRGRRRKQRASRCAARRCPASPPRGWRRDRAFRAAPWRAWSGAGGRAARR